MPQRGFLYRGDRTRTCNPRFWRPVLCQLSYAPSGSSARLYPRLRGHSPPVTDQEYGEQTHPEQDDLLEEQEGKGYGEDEGEREQSLPDE
jgi:hypothetical protein